MNRYNIETTDAGSQIVEADGFSVVDGQYVFFTRKGINDENFLAISSSVIRTVEKL